MRTELFPKILVSKIDDCIKMRPNPKIVELTTVSEILRFYPTYKVSQSEIQAMVIKE